MPHLALLVFPHKNFILEITFAHKKVCKILDAVDGIHRVRDWAIFPFISVFLRVPLAAIKRKPLVLDCGQEFQVIDVEILCQEVVILIESLVNQILKKKSATICLSGLSISGLLTVMTPSTLKFGKPSTKAKFRARQNAKSSHINSSRSRKQGRVISLSLAARTRKRVMTKIPGD